MPKKNNIFGFVRAKDYNKLENNFKKVVSGVRRFAAAQFSNMRAGWSMSRQEINSEIKSDRLALNARSYDMLFNSPFVAAMDWEDRFNVIGPEGFDLQPRAKYPSGLMDDFANQIIKNAFAKWSKREFCLVNKRYPFLIVQRMIPTVLRTDGELILRCYTKGKAIKGNPFGFTLDFVDANEIDHHKNIKHEDGTYTLMGVHVDEFRTLLGIWLKKKTIDQEITLGYNGGTEEYIPASELIYNFDPKHPKQIHGITAMSAALLRIKDADMWVEYSLNNAKYSAGIATFLKDTQPDSEPYDGDNPNEENGEQTENVNNIENGKDPRYMEVNGLKIVDLPWGREPLFHDPKFPHEQHDPFVRAVLRDAAMASGRDYAVVSGDRAGESYSSGRTGELKMFASYGYDQATIRELFLVEIYERWLEAALRANALAPLQFAYLEKYKEHYWQGYKKPWVDPLKKALSDKLEEEMRWKSKIDNQSERARRMEEVLEDEVSLNKSLEKYGLKINATENTQIIVEANPPDDNEDETETKKKQNF